jgi:putative acetyltransferase
MAVAIRLETDRDRDAIFRVNRLAFGRDDEARLVDALHSGGFVCLSLLAEMAGHIAGHVLFSQLTIEGRDGLLSALALAPLAVVPEFQRQGIGSELVRRGLDLCRERGHRIVLVVGHPQFYPRFGFSHALTRGLCSPCAGGSFMAAELMEGALRGVTGAVHYPPPFADF